LVAYHVQLTAAAEVKVYFCGTHSPWQRGRDENTHGLLRPFCPWLPKGTGLSGYSREQLDAVADQINGRPRK
jgi:IS30 family transposase